MPRHWLPLAALLLQLLLTLPANSPSGCAAFTRSEQGVKTVKFTQANNQTAFHKSLYKGARVKVHITCPDSNNSKAYKIKWILRRSPCAAEYSMLNERRIQRYYEAPEFMQILGYNYSSVSYLLYESDWLTCSKILLLPDLSNTQPTVANTTSPSQQQQKQQQKPARSVRAVSPTAAAAAAAAASDSSNSTEPADPGLIAKAWQDGIYLLVMTIECGVNKGDKKEAVKKACDNYELTVDMQIYNKYGYLSAIEWPLLPFYGAMCLLYILFGLLWLIFSAKYWREMLRIQFCISGVILLGMLEKALFYAEYQSINSSGQSVKGAILFAELVSCVKRSVARVLVLIVSLGYGIVKPRLGNLQHKVVAIGLVYFIFSAIECSLRSTRPRFEASRNAFYATIPLAIADAVICWWIFSSLVQTVRNLRVRRNLVKLSLYRHFTNTLVFCVLSSIVFMTWTIGRHRFTECITAWRELWIDEAFWHLLFSVILFVIIILWRPSQNNQRYAFTPLLDVGDDSDEEDDTEDVLMDNLSEGVKSRHSSSTSKQQQQQQHSRQGSKGAEDDLKWVEENIPQSLVESTLPSLLQDSDEEILTTKYEMSKME